MQRLQASLEGLLALSGVIVLGVYRPGLPDLPHSLSQPLTLGQVENITRLITWLALLALSLHLLHRAARRAVRGQPRPMRQRHLPSTLFQLEIDTSTPRALCERVPACRTPRIEQPVLLVSNALLGAERQTAGSNTSEAGAPDTQGKTDNRIAISILGQLGIESPLARKPKLRASATELIAHLAFHPQGATRDQLLDALWPGDPPRRSEQRLWQASSQARKLLGDALERNRDRYQLVRERVRLDLEEFDQLLVQAQQASSEESKQDLRERALALVRGEPLAGSDYPWADSHIRPVRATIIELLEQTGRTRLAGGNAHGALQAAEQGLAIDNLNEALWRLALQAEATLGHRQSLIERYESLSELLDAQLGLEPHRETRALYLTALGQT